MSLEIKKPYLLHAKAGDPKRQNVAALKSWFELEVSAAYPKIYREAIAANMKNRNFVLHDHLIKVFANAYMLPLENELKLLIDADAHLESNAPIAEMVFSQPYTAALPGAAKRMASYKPSELVHYGFSQPHSSTWTEALDVLIESLDPEVSNWVSTALLRFYFTQPHSAGHEKQLLRVIWAETGSYELEQFLTQTLLLPHLASVRQAAYRAIVLRSAQLRESYLLETLMLDHGAIKDESLLLEAYKLADAERRMEIVDSILTDDRSNKSYAVVRYILENETNANLFMRLESWFELERPQSREFKILQEASEISAPREAKAFLETAYAKLNAERANKKAPKCEALFALAK